MILVITESSDTTVDYVLPALRRAGHQILVWDSGRLPRDDRLTVSIVDGEPAWRLRTPDGVHDLSAVSTVWARRPSARSLRPATSAGGHGEFGLRASRALLDGLWNTLPARWFPGPPASAGPADDKVLQLLRAVEVGFTVPDTWFGNDPQVVVPAWHHADGALITKGFDPRDAQRGGELHVAYASRVRRRDLARRHRLADAPAILQPAVPKAVEVRAIVVGDQVLSTEVASQASRLTADDWRHYTGVRDVHRPHQLAPGGGAALPRPGHRLRAGLGVDRPDPHPGRGVRLPRAQRARRVGLATRGRPADRLGGRALAGSERGRSTATNRHHEGRPR